jgi:hypothetical protein
MRPPHPAHAWEEPPDCLVDIWFPNDPANDIARRRGDAFWVHLYHWTDGEWHWAWLTGQGQIDPNVSDPFYDDDWAVIEVQCTNLGVHTLTAACPFATPDYATVIVADVAFTHPGVPNITQPTYSMLRAEVLPLAAQPYLHQGTSNCGQTSVCEWPGIDDRAILLRLWSPTSQALYWHGNARTLTQYWNGQFGAGQWCQTNDVFLSAWVTLQMSWGEPELSIVEPRVGLFYPARSFRTADIVGFRDDVVPGQWQGVDCEVRWSNTTGFFSPQITWSSSKGSFTDQVLDPGWGYPWTPGAGYAKYHANVGQTGTDTILVTLTEGSLQAQASKTMTIHADHLARDYANWAALNAHPNVVSAFNCQKAVNHAWCGERDKVAAFRPPWGGEPFHVPPDEHYLLLFDRTSGYLLYELYHFQRGSIICVGKTGVMDVKMVLWDGTGGPTDLFGKDGGAPWRTVTIQGLLDEKNPDNSYKHDWLFVAEEP